MEVSYEVNLVIFDLNFYPRVQFDIDSIKRNVGDNVTYYRGSLTCKRKFYTFKLTRNGFCSVYLRGNFAILLSDISKLVCEVCWFLGDFCDREVESVFVAPKNIQITFHLLFERFPKFRLFCFKIIESLSSDYEFEIKESNSAESLWLPYVESDVYFSSLRIKARGKSKCIFSFSYTFKGNCLTADVAEFQKLCFNIRVCYLYNLRLNEDLFI